MARLAPNAVQPDVLTDRAKRQKLLVAPLCQNTNVIASQIGVTYLATKQSVAKDAQTVNVFDLMTVPAMTDGQGLPVTRPYVLEDVSTVRAKSQKNVLATRNGPEQPATSPFVRTSVRTTEYVRRQTRVPAKRQCGKETPATSLCA